MSGPNPVPKPPDTRPPGHPPNPPPPPPGPRPKFADLLATLAVLTGAAYLAGHVVAAIAQTN